MARSPSGPLVAQVAPAPELPDPPPPESGLDVPLLIGGLVIVGLVVASNVWLRRRAQRESDGDDESTPGSRSQ